MATCKLFHQQAGTVEATVLYITFTFRFPDNTSVTTKLLNISDVDSVQCGKMSSLDTFQRVMCDSLIELTKPVVMG